MFKIPKSRVIFISLAVVVVIYLVFWLPNFLEFKSARAQNDYYTGLAKLTEVQTPKTADFPDLLIWNLQKQVSEIRQMNSGMAAELQNQMPVQQEEATLVQADNILLLEVLQLLKPEYNGEIFNSYVDLASFTNYEQLPELVKIKQDLTEKLTLLKNEISLETADRKAHSIWVNPLWGKTNADLKKFAGELNSEAAAAQLLMFTAEGYNLSADLRNRLAENPPAGLIFMGANISSSNQIENYSKELQYLSAELPLLLASDQEGGPVKRISWDVTPGQAAWADKTNQEVCGLAKSRAATMKEAGINTNFSPVVDLTYNAITDNRSPAFINSRTISGDPAIVTEKALAYVTCLQQSGIFATLKHFPGHGATTEDSHFKLPIINKDKEDWLKSDAQPYLEIQEARLIMVGHLLFSELDNDNPATQSPEIITAILRNEMNYQGVIITDDLKQLLNSTNVPLREALKKAVNSGIDIVLYITTKENGQEAVRQLASLIESQEIPREKVNQAIVRILKLKMLINSQF